jgi:hypothetical protein
MGWLFGLFASALARRFVGFWLRNRLLDIFTEFKQDGGLVGSLIKNSVNGSDP